MKLGLLSACMPERALEEVASWAGAHGYRGARARGVAAARRPALHREPPGRRRVRRGRGRARARGARRQRARALGARLLRQQPASRPGRARGDPRPPARLHRRRRGARRRPGRDLHRPRSNPLSVADNLREAERVLPPLVDYAGERGRAADDRELRDGGVAPGRLPRATSPTRRSSGSGCSGWASTSTSTPRTCSGSASTRWRPCGPTSTA